MPVMKFVEVAHLAPKRIRKMTRSIYLPASGSKGRAGQWTPDEKTEQSLGVVGMTSKQSMSPA